MTQVVSALQHRHTDQAQTASLLTAGRDALAAGDSAQAERLFRRAVQLDVRSAAAWLALAETQVGARRAICLRWAALADQVVRQTAAPLPAARQWRRTRQLRRDVLAGALTLAGAITVLIVGSDLVYRDRVLPGVAVGPLAVGNQPLASIKQTLVARQPGQRLVRLRAGDRAWNVPLRTLLPDQAVAAAAVLRAYGHEPNVWRRTATRTRAMLGLQRVIVTPVANAAAVHDVVAAISARITQPRRDAQIVATAQGWTLLPEQTGTRIDQAVAVAELTRLVEAHAWEQTSTPLALTIQLSYDAPQRTAADLDSALAQLRQLQAQPLELVAGDQRRTLDRSMLMELDTAAQPRLTPGAGALARELDTLASELAVAPQPSYLEREGDRVRALVLGKPGYELDREGARERILAALSTGAASIELPLRELAPPPGEVEQLGLIAELGRGESQFLTYTSPERDANVQAGGNDIDGRLIAPGEVFSFTATVGEISEAKGYRWGEAIEAGTVVPSLGGGICQVSTTTFRAAFWSGLEIVERHNHSWRLPWYEVDAPPGMDATIALGGPDLKFRNNTGHYILIKVETDLVRKRQTVIVYGTPDGRKVEMQSLSNGNIGVQRRVLGDNGLELDDTFVSYYSQ